MELSILFSQAVEVRLLEKLPANAPMFLGRKDSKQIRRSAPCQIWTKLESSDLIKEVEDKINNHIEGKDFDDILHVYQTVRKMIPETENSVAVRIQEGHKWSQIGDFEPK
jgi:predicted transcriptional regulator